MMHVERFLEVGCGLGYMAALMAEAGGSSARVDTIEKSSLHAQLAQEEISNAGLEDRVRILKGRATKTLADLSEPYDVIFVDADWEDYP
jgi:predicted O-methyltransferase YrrM